MIISTIYKSLLRYSHDLIDQIRVAAPSNELSYWGWESRDAEESLPAHDLFGISGYDFRDNGGLWDIRVGFSLSSYDDANLFREAAILDIIHQNMVVDKKIPLRDTLTGDVTSELLVADFQISPMGQTRYRNYRPISVDLKRTANERAQG